MHNLRTLHHALCTKHCVLFIIILFFLPFTGKSQLINLSGKGFFLTGTNIAWKNYGWDFGDNTAGYGGGNGYDPIWWDNTFANIESYGGNSVRVWVHCKGEHNPLFDGTGKCTGLNTNFFNNLDALLQNAETHNLMVILCLFDFHLVDIGRQDIVKDTSRTNAYIKNALIPMVQRYNSQCNLIAWEIINEPEWVMQSIPGGGNYGSGAISITQMQRFAGMCASAIHANSSQYVTVGSASIKWNSDITPAVGNYWTNTALKTAAYNDNNAYLDFYQIHYYDWMGNGLSPYSKTKASWGLDKATIVGETGNEGFYNYQQQFDYSYSNGYAGCLPWAFESGGAATWAQFNNEMKIFRDNNISVVDFSCALLPISNPLSDNKIFSTSAVIERGNDITVKIESAPRAKTIRIIDMRGAERFAIKVENQTELKIRQNLESGMFIMLFETEDKVYYKKIIIQ